MKKVFVDTGAFLAKELASDQYHLEAKECWRRLAQRGVLFCSTEHVLDETMTLLARRTHASWAAEWGRDVLSAGFHWLAAKPRDWVESMELMRKYADQAVSYTDCLSFALMRGEGIRDCFTYDRHFQAAGFRVMS